MCIRDSSVFIPDARMISISSNLPEDEDTIRMVIVMVMVVVMMKNMMMRVIMMMVKAHLKAEISFLISLTSSSVTPSFSAFRCSCGYHCHHITVINSAEVAATAQSL